jgi:hypothetical protein
MFTDVLRGDPDHPADLQHPEYLTIAVAIEQSTRKPAYFAFHIPANADQESGVFITFAKTSKLENGKMDSKVEEGGYLDFHLTRVIQSPVCLA